MLLRAHPLVLSVSPLPQLILCTGNQGNRLQVGCGGGLISDTPKDISGATLAGPVAGRRLSLAETQKSKPISILTKSKRV